MTKFKEFYKNTKDDLEEAIDALHQANRVRHELEVKLQSELEAGFRIRQTLDEKMNLISDMEVRIDYFDQQRKADFAK